MLQRPVSRSGLYGSHDRTPRIPSAHSGSRTSPESGLEFHGGRCLERGIGRHSDDGLGDGLLLLKVISNALRVEKLRAALQLGRLTLEIYDQTTAYGPLGVAVWVDAGDPNGAKQVPSAKMCGGRS